MENNEEEFAAFEPYAILWDYLVNGKPEDMPDEVWVVLNWPYELVSLETYQAHEAIKVKYPEYFPWEALYRSIPQSVHDAYRMELWPGGNQFGEFFKEVDDKAYDAPFGGLIDEINKGGQQVSYRNKSFTFEDFAAVAQRHLEANEVFYKNFQVEKAMWDKHYSKFNLIYRG